jgi:predicted RNase H-like HicB family nuclease
MKQKFTATVWKEGNWYVARCIEVTVASQGKTERAALANLVEAMELLFEETKPA